MERVRDFAFISYWHFTGLYFCPRLWGKLNHLSVLIRLSISPFVIPWYPSKYTHTFDMFFHMSLRSRHLKRQTYHSIFINHHTEFFMKSTCISDSIIYQKKEIQVHMILLKISTYLQQFRRWCIVTKFWSDSFRDCCLKNNNPLTTPMIQNHHVDVSSHVTFDYRMNVTSCMTSNSTRHELEQLRLSKEETRLTSILKKVSICHDRTIEKNWRITHSTCNDFRKADVLQTLGHAVYSIYFTVISFLDFYDTYESLCRSLRESARASGKINRQNDDVISWWLTFTYTTVQYISKWWWFWSCSCSRSTNQVRCSGIQEFLREVDDRRQVRRVKWHVRSSSRWMRWVHVYHEVSERGHSCVDFLYIKS